MTVAPNAAATAAEPSVEPLSTTSARAPGGIRDSTHGSAAASLRHGKTMSITRKTLSPEPAGQPLPNDELRFALMLAPGWLPRLDHVMARVLVVDDDATLAEVVVGYLERAGHVGTHVSDGPAALAAVDAEPPDLMVLDLMLPGIDGLEVCRQVRASHPQLPVLMLTALNEAEDRIAGLEVGADDYLAKPFSPRELVLRVDSILRRASRAGPPSVLTAGTLTVDTAARRVTRGDREISLTVRELDLLAYLMAHPGQVFRREQLMQAVWGWTFGDQSTVTVHVRRLREKIEDDPTEPALIHTVWGVGYRLDVPVTAP
jgi:DNA-binding response OmpR family regulator